MKNNLMYTLRLALILLIITSCVAAALAGVNALTESRIAAQKIEKTRAAVAKVLEGTPQQLNLTGDTGMVCNAWKSEKGFAVEVETPGFDGPIVMMVGVDLEGKVTGIAIISQTETAGLGAVAAADTAAGTRFRDQFSGLSTGQTALSKDGGTLDALTGATISSRAITKGVEAALEFVAKEGL